MFGRNSRYRDAGLFEPDADGRVVFRGVRPRRIGPATGVVEHTVVQGNRLDTLAQHFYAEGRTWYRLVDANPEFVFAPKLLDEAMFGDVVLVPKARE